MKSCVLYSRVSTARQADAGLSLEAQQAKLRAWADAHGAEVIANHVDAGLSGRRADNRPGLQQALKDACDHQAVLVAYSLSRLGRSTRDVLAIADRLNRAGADLASLSEEINTNSACGKMIFRLLSVLSEFEADVIAERTRLALQYKRSRGEKTGGAVPYGFRAKGGRLVEDAHEQRGIKLALELRRKGLSLRAVAGQLHRDGYTTKPMDGKSLARILRRERG